MIIDEKSPSQNFKESRQYKSLRTRDLIYVAFFLIHIPATLILDLQAIYPKWLVPTGSPLRALGDFYMKMTGDPVVGSVGGYFGPEAEANFLWLKLFMYSELLVQLPTFFYGAYNLYHGTNHAILYPLLTAYGAGTAMTTLPCIGVLLTTPSAAEVGKTLVRETGKVVIRGLAGSRESFTPALTDLQRMILLSSYIPFFFIPLIISIDMALRSKWLLTAGLQALENKED